MKTNDAGPCGNSSRARSPQDSFHLRAAPPSGVTFEDAPRWTTEIVRISTTEWTFSPRGIHARHLVRPSLGLPASRFTMTRLKSAETRTLWWNETKYS